MVVFLIGISYFLINNKLLASSLPMFKGPSELLFLKKKKVLLC